MKNKFLKSLFLSTVLAINGAASAALVTIDFESYTSGVYTAGTDFSGVTFDQDIQLGEFDFLAGPATDGVIARQYFFILDPFTLVRAGSIGGSFSTTVSSFRIGAGDSCCDLDKIVLTGFDIFGDVVATDSYSGAASGFLEISGAGIASFFLDITDNNASGSSGFDNISFTTETVPLPDVFSLMTLGLGGLFFMKRRRMKNLR